MANSTEADVSDDSAQIPAMPILQNEAAVLFFNWVILFLIKHLALRNYIYLYRKSRENILIDVIV